MRDKDYKCFDCGETRINNSCYCDKKGTIPKGVQYLDASWNGKNRYSVHTRCFDCKTWGINFPQDARCGNCNSMDTMQYWDAETISEQLAARDREIWNAARGIKPEINTNLGLYYQYETFEDYEKERE